MKNSLPPRSSSHNVRLVAWRSPVTAWVLLLSLFAVAFHGQLAVGETVVKSLYSKAVSGPRSWDWLSPFRMQQAGAEGEAGFESKRVVQALATDMPQQPSMVRPAGAENSTSGSVASLEWLESQTGSPPELNRPATQRRRLGWMNWSQPSEKTNKAGLEAKSTSQNRPVAQSFPTVGAPQQGSGAGSKKAQGFNPFSWADSKSQEQASRVRTAAAELNPGDSFAGLKVLHPFSWTNTTEAANESGGVNQASSGQQASQRFPKLEAVADTLPTGKELVSPMSWSNEPNDATPPRPLEPPVQTSFSKSVQQALQWEDWTGKSEKELLDASRPPANATVDQLIEWEKQKHPWIRPFYWSEDLEASSPAYEGIRESLQSSPGRSRATALVKPFLWTNEQPVASSRPRMVGDSRTVAFLQGDELVPLPPEQLLVPGQERLPGSSNESGDDFFGINGKGESDSEEGLLGETGEGEKGVLGEAETLGREPVDNSLQFLRASTVLLEPGQAQYDYGMTYSLFDQQIPVFVTSGGGTSVILARFRRREMLIPLEVRYGLTRKIQLFLNAPFGWSNNEFTAGAFEEFENDGGLGDIIFGGTFLLRQGNHEKSDVIMTLATTAPTGQDPFAAASLLAPSAPALGGGTWSLASNVLFVRNYDPVVFFYGLGTRQHFLRKVNGRNFRPGGEYNYLMGVGFAVNERITFSTRFNGAYVSETRLDSARIRGTIQEPMAIGLAMTISDPKKKKLVEPFVSFGLTDDTNNVRFGITWTR